MSTEWMAMVSAANTQRERSSREMASGDHCATNLRHLSRSEPVPRYALENHVDHGIWAAAQNESVVASFANVAVGAYSTLTLPSAPFACSSACSTSPKVATTICSKPFRATPVSHCATYTPISSTIVRSFTSSTIAMR